MAFTIQELDNIQNSALDVYLNKGTVFKQNVQNKPMSKAFEDNSGTFPTGGRGNVSMAVKGGQGGGALQGYTHDDQVGYYNPASQKRISFSWKEMHIGIGVTHTELKDDGITVTESGADQRTSEKDGREIAALANMLDEKLDDFAEDYAVSWDALIHGDGTTDAKSIAGIRAFILDAPQTGITGGLGRAVNTWWRNRAATAASAAAGGMGAITSSTANGGALLQFLQNERRQLDRYAQGGTKRMSFAGSAFINAMETELRANGNYTLTGWNGSGAKGAATADMPDVSWDGKGFIYDPKLDDLGYSKRMYTIDMKRIRILYMIGERMKKANPARPYDRYVMYKAITTTAVMVCQQLNTSGVYDIN